MTPTKFPPLLLILLIALRSVAQQSNTVFLSEGKIEFERKVNNYARMGDEENSWTDLQKKAMPQFTLSYFNLSFTPRKTLYAPGKEGTVTSGFFYGTPPADKNIVLNDFEKEQSLSQKQVMDQQFLIQDSLRKIHWKITGETRDIAGFTCRRANAVIMDSIYVVAFYTDEILATGGPESFQGLPGMILGIALPHQHITWFATKVEAVPVAEKDLAAPQKGKKIDEKALKALLEDRLKNWGRYGRQALEAAML